MRTFEKFHLSKPDPKMDMKKKSGGVSPFVSTEWPV